MHTTKDHPGRTGVARTRRLAVGVILFALIGAVCAANPSFASLQNLRDLLVQSAPVVIVGCGMTLVVLVGEIDISAGSLLGVLAALMGVLSSPQHMGLPAPAIIALTLLAGMAVGFVDGHAGIAVGKVPSIVATLGMLTILRGITELVLGGNWITDLPPSIRYLGTGSVAGIPLCIWGAAIVAASPLRGHLLHSLWHAPASRRRQRHRRGHGPHLRCPRETAGLATLGRTH